MPVALFLIIGGFTLIYSALKGLSLTDVFSGATGDKLDPKGGNTRGATDTPSYTNAAGFAGDTIIEMFYDPLGSWDAPNADTRPSKGGAIGGHGDHVHVAAPKALLAHLKAVAQEQFHLTITSTTGGSHVINSWHYRGMAFDAGGTAANMAAFFKYVEANHTGGSTYSKGGGAD